MTLRVLSTGAWFFLLIGLSFASPAAAVPYTPADDQTVLERLPRAIAGEQTELRTLRRGLDDDPGDLPLALKIADRYIRLGRSEADPRFYGAAEAVLRPWFAEPRPRADVLVMRAILAQHRHDFAAAATDLRAALVQSPGNARAWLTLAAIERAQGRYREASQACGGLFRAAPLLVTFTCLADVGSLTGQAQEQHARLQAMLENAGDVDPEIRVWATTVLAESAARAGDSALAERHFRDALAVGVHDTYLLGAWADFLSDQNRPAEVAAVLADEGRADALLLRLAIARRSMGDRRWVENKSILQQRIDANRLRGDSIHLREEARFALSLADDPAAALRLAEENWRVQREPADARLLLEAALAAGIPSAAQPILDWLAETRLQDPAVTDLERRLREFHA